MFVRFQCFILSTFQNKPISILRLLPQSKDVCSPPGSVNSVESGVGSDGIWGRSKLITEVNCDPIADWLIWSLLTELKSSPDNKSKLVSIGFASFSSFATLAKSNFGRKFWVGVGIEIEWDFGIWNSGLASSKSPKSSSSSIFSSGTSGFENFEI